MSKNKTQSKKELIEQQLQKLEAIRRETSRLLLEEIKRILHKLICGHTGVINVTELYQEDLLERIAKYETPKDEAGNFVLESFGFDKRGRFIVTGTELYDDVSEFTFTEDAFTVDELAEIHWLLTEIEKGLAEGRYMFENGGYLVEARYRKLGYYNDSEDLRAFADKNAEEIFTAMVMGEGHFYRSEEDDNVTVEDLREKDPEGRTVELACDAGIIVVNGAKGLSREALEKDDPDSPVFIDIYELDNDKN